MHFPTPAQVGDVAAGDPHRAADAAGRLGEALERGDHDPALLGTGDGGAHRVDDKPVCDAGALALENKVEGGAVWRVDGGAAAAVIDLAGLDAVGPWSVKEQVFRD